jgi:arylsulfatase A-like enzyme/tetratricopeptide (TPR) repeat protein
MSRSKKKRRAKRTPPAETSPPVGARFELPPERPAGRGLGRRALLASAVTLVVVAAVVIGILILGKGRPAETVEEAWQRAGVEKPNVLLISLDTTRADHLPAYGYAGVRTPNLDGLASRAVLFEQCSTPSPLTLPAHSSILTGTYPTFHGVRVNGNTALAEEQETLAEVMAQNGYATAAFIGAFVLDGRWGLDQGFTLYDDKFDLRKYKQLDLGLVQRPANEIVDAALAWLEKEKNAPFFAWVHLYDPHLPYEPPEPYRTEYARGGFGLYDGEIAFMDAEIGRLLRWLETNGLDGRTSVVVVGDHGEALGDHGELAHGYFIYDSTVRVPFLLTTPVKRLNGARVKSQVSLVDVFPTVLDVAGLGAPARVQGRTVLPLAFDPRRTEDERPAYSESMTPSLLYGWSPLFALRTSGHKLIDAPRPELFDLAADPGEFVDIQNRQPRVALDLKRRLDALMVETGRDAPAPRSANLDKETVERLAALGYIGAPASKPHPQRITQDLADPKDKLQVYEWVQQAGELLNLEKYGEAATALERALGADPKIPQALLLLATCYTELGRKDEAKARLDLILKDDANNIQALISLANILLAEGRKDDVKALCERALAVDERSTQAYALLGEIHMTSREHAQALPYLEKAVAIQPKLTQNSLNLAACYVGLKEYAKAEELLRSILADYPKFPLANYHLGLMYEEQGRLEEAQAVYNEEFKLYPDHFRARFNHGQLLLRAGDLDGYLAAMREVMATAPQAPEGFLFLARGLLKTPADLAEVKDLIAKGLARAATSELKALGYFLLADVYSREGREDLVQGALAEANRYRGKK